jgi:hypothetical protein
MLQMLFMLPLNLWKPVKDKLLKLDKLQEKLPLLYNSQLLKKMLLIRKLPKP